MLNEIEGGREKEKDRAKTDKLNVYMWKSKKEQVEKNS